MKDKRNKIIIPLISVFLGILLGVIVLELTGKNSADLFSGLLRAGTGIDLSRGKVNLRFFGEFLVTSMPIILTGLSIGFAYRTGMFNIGCEGQVIVGSLISCIFALVVPLPSAFAVVICVIAGGVGGALWAFIPGILKSKFNISEVVTGIMLNYTALYGANYFLKLLPAGINVDQTAEIPAEASLASPFLKGLTNNSRLHWGIIVVILAVVAYWFIIEKTSFGYSLRATGFNSEAARYAGIKVKKNIVTSIMISGFLAGLAGALIVLGTFGYGRVMVSMEQYGFDGIAVALVGLGNAVGIVLSGFLFGLLKVAQTQLQANGIPKEIGEIIASSIVFFVAIQYAISLYGGAFIEWIKKKVPTKQKQSSKEEGVK
ncbi:MAG: ABC transporter permease [Anaerorhabdus sp.]